MIRTQTSTDNVLAKLSYSIVVRYAPDVWTNCSNVGSETTTAVCLLCKLHEQHLIPKAIQKSNKDHPLGMGTSDQVSYAFSCLPSPLHYSKGAGLIDDS